MFLKVKFKEKLYYKIFVDIHISINFWQKNFTVSVSITCVKSQALISIYMDIYIYAYKHGSYKETVLVFSEFYLHALENILMAYFNNNRFDRWLSYLHKFDIFQNKTFTINKAYQIKIKVYHVLKIIKVLRLIEHNKGCSLI